MHQVNKPSNLNQMEPIQNRATNLKINQPNSRKLTKQSFKKKNIGLKSCKISAKPNPIWPYPFQSNKPNHTYDHKAITKLKISETH
jgi:hypothetical protein